VALETTTPAERAALVREWTDGRGADVVVEATGVKAAFGEGTDLLADHGAYLVLGLYAGTGTVPLDPYRLTNRCLRVVGGLGATDPSAHRTTIRPARRLGERLRFADLVTHRFPLPATAIGAAGSGEAVNAVVQPTT